LVKILLIPVSTFNPESLLNCAFFSEFQAGPVQRGFTVYINSNAVSHCDVYLQVPEFNEGQLICDIRGFYNMYCQEHLITGRSIARIFHGIASPCFPAKTWGRVRRYWRSHLDVDFNALMKIATRELIALR